MVMPISIDQVRVQIWVLVNVVDLMPLWTGLLLVLSLILDRNHKPICFRLDLYRKLVVDLEYLGVSNLFHWR